MLLNAPQGIVANGTPQPTNPSPKTTVEILDSWRQYSGAASPPIVKTDYTYSINPPQSAVIVHQPGVLAVSERSLGVPLKLRPASSRLTCPECGESLKTKMVYTANKKTHIFAATLGLVGFACCLCTIPYLVNNCKTGHHFCSNCDNFLGSYNPDKML